MITRSSTYKIATKAWSTVQIKQAPEKVVVAEETVTDTSPAHNVLKRALHSGKRNLQPLDQLPARMPAKTRDPTQQKPDGQKLFLHRAVSRWLPSPAHIAHWHSRVLTGPKLHINECVITLLQPNTKRPACSFMNPRKHRDKRYSVNDAISYCAVVLIANEQYPEHEYDEASHVCGQRRCVNVEHLRWEALNVNAERNLCHHYGVPCFHSPKCIMITANDMRMVQTRLNQLTRYFFTKNARSPRVFRSLSI